MVLPVVHYGDPVLRKKGARIESITPEVRKLVADMFDTMYDSHGIGLAAQQIGQALQLTVIDVRGMKDRPSTMQIDGATVDVDAHMPLALLNPVITPSGTQIKGPEGCLSFPEIFGDVIRPETVQVEAIDPEGKPVRFTAGGLLARCVQHEVDHLNGILFIDRMSADEKSKVRPEIDDLQADTKKKLAKR
jgi:peptide deformylase